MWTTESLSKIHITPVSVYASASAPHSLSLSQSRSALLTLDFNLHIYWSVQIGCSSEFYKFSEI